MRRVALAGTLHSSVVGSAFIHAQNFANDHRWKTDILEMRTAAHGIRTHVRWVTHYGFTDSTVESYFKIPMNQKELWNITKNRMLEDRG